jgi:hypothetical protein
VHAEAPVGLEQQPLHPVVVLQVHMPPAQRVPGPQAAPHAPQFALSVARSKQPLGQAVVVPVQPHEPPVAV